MGRRTYSRVVVMLVCPWFLCVQAFPLYSQEHGCTPADLRALEVFMKGLASGVISGWHFNGSSASSIDCCKWVGVTCKSSRVVGLDLSGMGLRGSFSTALASLDRLETLDLMNNSLSGSVPHQVFHMQRLQVLSVSSNSFSGVIPTNSSLPSLQVFNISHNKFNGVHPILNSSKLVKFDASFNRFSGPFSPSICIKSPGIQKLYLSENLLVGDFPVGLGNCSSLQELGLDSNFISGTLPDDLFRLSLLKLLYLQENSLSGTLSAGIGNLSNLVELDLSSNRFWGAIPNVFSSLRMLRSLHASSNGFVGTLPSSLSNLSAIQVLNLKNNSLGGEINLRFTDMVRLGFLNLGSNEFAGIVPHELSSCVNLKMINLARNNLVGEIPGSFKNLTALSDLSLSNNSLSNLSSALRILQHCPSLTALVLTMNFHGETIPPSGIQGFKALQYLVIANCAISGSIPPWLAQCTELQVVDLSWNKLDGGIPSWVGDLHSLFYLDLSNNSLTGHIPLSLTNMTSLASLSASPRAAQQGSSPADLPFFSNTNHARALQYNQFNKLPSSINLRNNNLTGHIWPQFGNLKRIRVLDLSVNKLSGTIPEELSGMGSLENLNLSYNELEGNIPLSLNKLTFLSRFSVAYNNLVGLIPTGTQFSTFPDSSFEGNPGLCFGRYDVCLKAQVPSLIYRGEDGEEESILGLPFVFGIIAGFLPTFLILIASKLY